MPDWVDRIIEHGARAVVAAVTGTSSFALYNGEGLGRQLFKNFTTSLQIKTNNDYLIPPKVYEDWGSQIVQGTIQNNLDYKLPLLLLPIALLIVHVVYKKELLKIHERDGEPAAAAAGEGPPEPENSSGIISAFKGFYRNRYFMITCVIFVLLAFASFITTSKFFIIGLFLIITLPSIIYLLMYSGDIKNGSFGERAAYAVVGVVFIFELLVMPMQYASHGFDIDLRQVERINGVTTAERRNGTYHVKDDLLCTISDFGEGLFIDFFKVESKRYELEQRNGRMSEYYVKEHLLAGNAKAGVESEFFEKL